jgi:serine protease AprX
MSFWWTSSSILGREKKTMGKAVELCSWSRLVFTSLSLCVLVVAGGPIEGICSEAANYVFTTESTSEINQKISPWLLGNLHTANQDGFLVILREQADLRHTSRHATKMERGQAVYQHLQGMVKSAQDPVRRFLDTKGVRYRPFFIANMVHVFGEPELIFSLAARSDIWRIEGNPAVHGVRPRISTSNRFPNSEHDDATDRARDPEGPQAVEWNLTKVRAPEVWSAYGTTGEGVVVAGADTGVQWDHPALKSHYRGWNGSLVSHDYNWHDAIHSGSSNLCGYDSPVPCDDYGHGTHTMGIMVGDDGSSNQIGVAPGAKWIGCRNMNDGIGTPARYIECFEFFLAPYAIGSSPSSGDPAKAPHIINNSWECPASEGCGQDSLRLTVESVRAAGIMVVAAATNSGPGCGTVSTPPAIYDASFTVGSTDSSDVIAGSSSRGPVTVDGSNRLKPDISAPGVSVRSSIPVGNYGYMSGTSMAAPHVAGAAALLWSAAPNLIGDVDTSESLLVQWAVPRTSSQNCGGILGDQVPNNTYGWGRLDVLSTVQAAVHYIYVGQDGLCGSKSLCFTSVQKGIDSAQSFTIIEVTQETYYEDVKFDDPKVVALQGGWDTKFTSSSSYTTIQGSITITNGTMILENIILK